MMSDEQIIPVKIKKSTISPLWLFTLLAIILGGWLLFKSIKESGIRINILFQNAQGIEAGRTAVRYQGLDIGIIKKVDLSKDLNGVIAEAEIFPQAKQLVNKDTLFWIVKPKASLTGISGLDALVGGNYIAILPGKSPEKEKLFIAQIAPPNIISNEENLLLYLITDDLASLSIGSGVYYKKIRVGEVFHYELNNDDKNIVVSAIIEEKYTNLIKDNSRFWNISGIKANIDLQGINVEVGNLPSLLAGGIAFDSPKDGEKVKSKTKYVLYPSINEAQRGIAINIELPLNHGIKNENLSITYQGSEVGKLNSIHFNQSYNGFIAKANIDPSMAWLLKSESEFIIEQPQLSFNGAKNLSGFLTGNTLSIKPGLGEQQFSFSAKTQTEQTVSRPETLRVQLLAEDAQGISIGTKVIYKGIEVGFVHKYELNDSNQIAIELAIQSPYRHLIKSQSRFFRVEGLSAFINQDGIEVSVAPLAQLAQSAISFTSIGSNAIADTYYLFDSSRQAKKAKLVKPGFKTYTLIAENLPSISKGSPVMFKNVTVGEVNDFILEKNHIKITLRVNNQYAHLITKDTVFWDHSGIDVNANLSGVSVQAASLTSIFKGGISFADLSGIRNKQGNDWILYSSLAKAQNQGVSIRFASRKSYGLKEGSPIHFQGVKVGEVKELVPEFEQNTVRIDAIIYAKFAKQITRSQSYFWVSIPKISLSKTENLGSLLTPSISVAPGKGKNKDHFTLQESEPFFDGLTLTLETEYRDSVAVGTPILFRDLEVGNVTNVKLGHFADRVLIEIKILAKYKHLVRSNSVFWNQSGLDVNFSLSGAEIKTGTADSVLRGGISFATPETKLEPIAKNNQRFLLHKEAQKSWKTWRTAIPRPE